jgi:hypothetical protein
MKLKRALKDITSNCHLPALNYCVKYAEMALTMLYEGHATADCDGDIDWISNELDMQLRYVLNNMTHWRSCKASNCTGDRIKEIRHELKTSLKRVTAV